MGYEYYEILNTADILITDYSSVFYDFANSGRKIILYTYDKEEYFRDRGVYVSLDDFPFPQAENVDGLMELLIRRRTMTIRNSGRSTVRMITLKLPEKSVSVYFSAKRLQMKKGSCRTARRMCLFMPAT